MDLYEVLGISSSATPAAVRAAYVQLAARYHPDQHNGNPLEDLATEKLAQLNRAYEILSDPQKRARYDAGRGAAPQSGTRAAPPHVQRVTKLLGWLMVGGLLLRVGPMALRLLWRTLLGAGSALRGTPAGLICFFLMVGCGLLWLRSVRRRHKR